MFKKWLRKGSKKRESPGVEPAAEVTEGDDDLFTMLDTDDCATAANDSQVALRPELRKQISKSEFTCSCCYDLLIQPTTLTCGHSFCRLCLANWYQTSRKQICPECRQSWQGLPQVNFLLRSTIEKLFPGEVAQRKTETLDRQAEEAIAQFDAMMGSTAAGTTTRPRVLRNAAQQHHVYLGVGILVGVAAIVMFSSVWDYVFVRGGNLSRPVSRWSEQDVAQWLGEVGPWALEHIGPVFQEKQIDGVQMLVLSDEDIAELPALTDLQRKAFSMELYAIREHGMKAPYTMAEFRDRHLAKSSMYLHAMPRFPRLTLFFIMLFDYNDSFLPLIHVTETVFPDINDVNLYTCPLPNPTFRQWVCYFVKWVMLPYVPCIQLVWHVSNWYLTFVMFIYCGSLTVTDILGWFKIYRRLWGHGEPTVMRSIGNMLLIYLVTCIAPSFLLRLHFNVMVNIMPFYYLYRAYNDLQTHV